MAEYIGPSFASKNKKDVLVVTLEGPDGADRVLHVKPPTLGDYRGIVKILDIADKVSCHEADYDDFDFSEIAECCAAVLSNNVEHERITAEYLDETGFDLDDAGELMGAFVFFVSRLVDEKNYRFLGTRLLPMTATGQGERTATR